MGLHRWIFLGICLLGGVWIFARLGDRYLWDDEAETALLARSILHHGVPAAVDGDDVISQRCGLDRSSDGLWRMHPWLPMYVTAGSFAILGEGTWQARFFFSVAGWLCIPLVGCLGWILFQRRMVGLVAMMILTFSVPFILYSRQCRYYSLVMLGGVLMVLGFLGIREGRKWAAAAFLTGSVVVFHSHFLVFGGMLGGLLLGMFLLSFSPDARKVLGMALLTVVMMNLPFVMIYDVWGVSQGGVLKWSLLDWWSGVGAGFLKLDLYALPMAGLVGTAFFLWLKKGGSLELEDGKKWVFLAVLLLVNVVVAACIPVLFFRYLAQLLPVCALLTGFLLVKLWDQNRGLALFFGVLMVGTGWLHGWSRMASPDREKIPLPWKFPLREFAAEIRGEQKGFVEVTVEYLNRQAQSGDSLYVTHGDLPLRFYTKLKVHGGLSGQDMKKGVLPDWIIIRPFFRMSPPIPSVKKNEAEAREYLDKVIPWQEYEKVVLDVVDTGWENIPEPEAHLFRMPEKGPKVVLYRHHPSVK